MEDKLTIRDGVYTAMVTPFTSEGTLDRQAWERLVGRQVDAGVSGIVPAGCTGEAAVLSRDEQEYLVRSAVEICRGRAVVIAGSGTNSTETTLVATRDVESWGADVAMLITPYYNKPQQHGLRAHYQTVARSVSIPLMLYNVPGRTACNMSPETAAELAAEPTVIAVKEASGNLDQVERMIAQTGLQIFSGEDGLNFQIYGLGASGAVSVISNLLPGSAVRMWEAWHAGDIATAWKLSRLLEPTARACFVETSPAPVKELLSLAGLCRREPRLPLMPVTEDSLQYLVQFYESILADLMSRDREVRG
jgi:4-hydroxy-tetrahydrodipicolinate synthase